MVTTTSFQNYKKAKRIILELPLHRSLGHNRIFFWHSTTSKAKVFSFHCNPQHICVCVHFSNPKGDSIQALSLLICCAVCNFGCCFPIFQMAVLIDKREHSDLEILESRKFNKTYFFLLNIIIGCRERSLEFKTIREIIFLTLFPMGAFSIFLIIFQWCSFSSRFFFLSHLYEAYLLNAGV